MNMPKKYNYVELSKIDENVIKKVREINEHSENYSILRNTIIEDDQRYPITLRKLTKAEQVRAKPGAIYGIIDGHHRYRIASKSKKEDILADVLPDPPENYESYDSDIHDIKLALRLNESSIKMTNKEKGKIIYELMCTTGKSAPDIADEIFGVKTSMAYRCLNAYKKSVGEIVLSKPRNIDKFNIKTLKNAWLPISKIKILPDSIEECISCLENIADIEKELRKFKRALLVQNGVQEELNRRKSNEQK